MLKSSSPGAVLIPGLPELPTEFEWVRGRRGISGCRAADVEGLSAAGFEPDGTRASERLPDAEEAGREPLGLIQVHGASCLARRFTHGGLARAVTGARFKDPARPFHELLLSERLRSLGIRTPRVVAARAVRVRPAGYELTLVTERMAGVQDMGWLLGEVRRGQAPASQLKLALRASGELIGDLHRVGFIHADLQPANLLLELEKPESPAAAIDLDRSRFESEGPLTRALAENNLGRLWRHVARREREHGAVLSRADQVRFLLSYGVPRAELGAWGAAIEAAAQSKGLGHRLGWWLEKRVGRRVDRRAVK